MHLMPAAIALLLFSPAANTQTAADPPNDNSAALHDYESCTFDDGLQIAKIDALPPGVQERTVQTKDGPRTIRMLAGRRIMFAYGIGGDYFANVKPEVLPSEAWAAEKQALLDEMAALLTSDHESIPDTRLPSQMHGLEVHGFDRTVLKGSTLGFYLLFDNTRHIATGVYLLNQNSLMRRFQTIEQYRSLRTRFLITYTGCIVQNQALHAHRAKDSQ